MPRTRLFVRGALLSALAVGLLGSVLRVSAQEMEAGFPAHIHTGTCEQLDPAPAYPLADVHHGVIARVHQAADDVGEAVKRVGEGVAGLVGGGFDDIRRFDEEIRREHPDVIPVNVSETKVEVSLSDLVASPHAINIHESADNIETYIACGDIVGTPVDDNLSVALGSESDSGYSGVAWLRGDGDHTHVIVFLSQGLPDADAEATPAP